MIKKHTLTEQDQDIFRDAMRGVKPIIHSKVPLAPAKKETFSMKQAEEPEIDFFSDHESLPSVSGQTLLQYAQPGIQHKILRNLRNGKYNIEATLDLHGMTVDDARKSLSYFLLKCQKMQIRHVLIIHGKGRDNKPILKNKLNHWLRQTEQILAFCSAVNKDGSSGALYVWLKASDADTL